MVRFSDLWQEVLQSHHAQEQDQPCLIEAQQQTTITQFHLLLFPSV